MPKGGPDGGDGGDGGDVYIKVDPQLNTLHDLIYRKKYKAENGRPGEGAGKSGKKGQSVNIRVPPGTEVKNAVTGELLIDCVEEDRAYLLLKGGRGGRGNKHFATPVNRTPRFAEEGKPGTELEIELTLKILADVGLVGLPNAGKSSLLAKLTTAKPRIADYPFTTLSPNLGIVKYGSYQSFVLADIPGLIEGAHSGKGLGHQFLQHIERTRALVLMIDITDRDLFQSYQTLLNEMKQYDAALLKKPRLIALNKIDLVQEIQPFSPENEEVVYISAVTGENLSELISVLDRYLQNAGK